MRVNYNNISFNGFLKIGKRNTKPKNNDTQYSVLPEKRFCIHDPDGHLRESKRLLSLGYNLNEKFDYIKNAYTYTPDKNAFITIKKDKNGTSEIKLATYSNCNTISYKFDKNNLITSISVIDDKNEQKTEYSFNKGKELTSVEVRGISPVIGEYGFPIHINF